MNRLKAYLELTKPRITLLLLAVAVASFYIASPGAVDWLRWAMTTVGTGLLAAGIFALNAWWERGTDVLMRRTERRPLPSGRLHPAEALAFGSVLTVGSVALITAFLGWVAGAVALFTFASYVLVYTPLKRRTVTHTALGALSGAMPPLLGWAGARGSLDGNAWILFGILFLWQFPHFLAIEIMHRDDYARAGIRVLPVVSPGGYAAGIGIVIAIVLLLGVGAAPAITGLASLPYLCVSLLLGAGFLACGVLALIRGSRQSARVVLLASVAYLPLVFGMLSLSVQR